MNRGLDRLGLSGAEEAFEEYLRGIDGEKTIVEDEYGNVVDEYISKEPIPGCNVYLTIDIDGQIAALNKGDLKGVSRLCENVLELVTGKSLPVIGEVEDFFMRLNHLMK